MSEEVEMTVEELYLHEVAKLPPEDRLRLMELIARDLTERHNHSILELRGLGKDIWEGVDAQEYVDALRREWGQPA